jgi:hypothetical protein
MLDFYLFFPIFLLSNLAKKSFWFLPIWVKHKIGVKKKKKKKKNPK